MYCCRSRNSRVFESFHSHCQAAPTRYSMTNWQWLSPALHRHSDLQWQRRWGGFLWESDRTREPERSRRQCQAAPIRCLNPNSQLRDPACHPRSGRQLQESGVGSPWRKCSAAGRYHSRFRAARKHYSSLNSRSRGRDSRRGSDLRSRLKKGCSRGGPAGQFSILPHRPLAPAVRAGKAVDAGLAPGCFGARGAGAAVREPGGAERCLSSRPPATR
jgi:hypothetical protein